MDPVGMTTSHLSSGIAANNSTLRTANRFSDFSPRQKGDDSTKPLSSLAAQAAAKNPWPWSGTIGGGLRGDGNTSGAFAASNLEGSSSLLPGSGEHKDSNNNATTWSSASKTWASTENPDLSRSPVRVRVNSQSSDMPRSTSPYNYRPGGLGNPSLNTSPGSEGYLDPATANASIGEALDFQNRGRTSGGNRFGGSSILGNGVVDDDAELRRGRGLSGSRIIGPSDLRSESLPPQARATSSPPTRNDGSGSPPRHPGYTHIPTSHPSAAMSHQQQSNMLGYGSSMQGLYGDTREAELFAQIQRMSVDDGEGSFSIKSTRRPHHSLSHSFSHGLGGYTPNYGDMYTARQGLPGTASPWADDTGYAGSEVADAIWAFSNPRTDVHSRSHSGTMSPGEPVNGDYGRRGYGTPPSGMDAFRSPSSSGSQGRNHNGQIGADLYQRLQEMQNPNQYHRHSWSPYGYPDYNMRMPGGIPGYSSGIPPLSPPNQSQSPASPVIAAARREDFAGLRSVLLEEFRSSSKSNKRYELKDIYHHVVEFSGDQHGSRFIQQKLETANSDEKEAIFVEIKQNSLQLMTDVFGNYVIQKFFEHGSQLQKSILAKQMEGHVLTLSLQMYGCRVVQKALEHILTEQQATLVKELDGHILKCVKDQNGNHVVQKAIERVPSEHISFIVKAFQGHVHSLATHPYGCRVIQRMLEHCTEEAQRQVLTELHACVYNLIQDTYGNYVVQHVIEHGQEEDREKIVKVVTSNLLSFSKHKFASNVVEKSIDFGTVSQKSEIIRVITTPRATDGTSPLQLLIRDQYGNYVIQKLLNPAAKLEAKDKEVLVEQIKVQLGGLKKFSFGKQISAIEKLIFPLGGSGGSGVSYGLSTQTTSPTFCNGIPTGPANGARSPPRMPAAQAQI